MHKGQPVSIDLVRRYTSECPCGDENVTLVEDDDSDRFISNLEVVCENCELIYTVDFL